jgi:anaerobic magnesium-protoporphyrin IX monomethyl ester cyclase
MKIAFIEPRSTVANVYSRLPMPLLGPVYLGTILKNRGHDVQIYKEDICAPDYRRLDVDFVGISILTSTAKRGYEIARLFPKEKVILGGVHASLVPDEALLYAGRVVVGEAEGVIADIVEGRCTDTIIRGKAVEELDSLPYPDFSLIKGYKSPGVMTPISTSRGCPFDCSFCSVTKMFGRKYRFRSTESVINELTLRNEKNYFFCDDNFTAAPNRSRKLLDALLKLKIGDWACQVRCDVAKDVAMLKSMARAGCKVVCVGIESINHKTLQAYDKKQTLDEIISAIKSFHKEKISVHGMFVLGGDDDNKKTVWDTVKFAIRHKIDTIQMSILTPFPGTKVHEDLEKEKRIFSRDWDLYDGQHTVFEPKLLSARELQANTVKAYARFYSLFNAMSLLLRLRFRNAFFRFMGYSIVKEWKRNNRAMTWLLKPGSCH